MEEDKIIDELKNGNQEHFAYLYQKYEKSVYSNILKIVHNREVADELLQISFMKLYKNINLFDKDKGSFCNFVCAIAKYTAVDYLKKKNNTDKIMDTNIIYDDNLVNFVKVGGDVLNDVERSDFMRILKNLVNELCDTQRIAIILVCERGFSYKHAAKIMGVSESSFKSILYRARQTLKEKICRDYPEYKEDISSRKYITKMIVMVFIGITAISGLAYATFMICNEIWGNNTFTLSELRNEVTHDESIVSKDEALEKLNYYLDVLGDEKASADEVKLIKDYQMYKICWTLERDDVLMKIDSEDGKLVKYNNFTGSDILSKYTVDELYEKLDLPNDYELCEKEDLRNAEQIKYAKKYENIYNNYESVTYFINNDKLVSIAVLNYKYEDADVKISKERALEIAKENGIEVDEIELTIEKIATIPQNAENKIYQVINENNREDMEIFKRSIKIRKVWIVKTLYKNYYIDVLNGELMNDIR